MQGDYVVLTDNRLVVLTQDPEGNPIVLFDGFAQVPQVDLAAQQQSVTFVAQGVAIRLWDSPITGRLHQRLRGIFDDHHFGTRCREGAIHPISWRAA